MKRSVHVGRPQESENVDGRLEQLFIAQYARCVRIAARVLADASEAQDAAQDAFIAYHRRFAGQWPDNPAAWLHRATFHLALNRLRSTRRRLLRELTSPPPWRESDPVVMLERKEDRRKVSTALARLRPKYSAVLALRYSGLSYRETAEALGVGTGQVGTLLRRAEAALRKEILGEPSQ